MRRRRHAWVGAVGLWAAVSLVPHAALADASEEDIAEARTLFVSGQRDVDAGRWADAVDNFERAYELSGVPTALYNLGFALRALGRHRDSRDAFDRLIREHPDFDAERLEQAEVYLDEAKSRVAVIEILALADALRYRISFDGQRVEDDGDRPISIDTDPGSHTLSVRHSDSAPFLWEGNVSEGELLSVTYEPTEDDDESGGGEEEGSSVFESPWFWVITGAIVAAGAGVGLFLYWDSLELEPNNPGTVSRL